MGRYYSTNNFDGKFGFGVQSSYDPEDVFGMDEIDDKSSECETHFYMDATDENIAKVKEAIDEQYDFLEIPADERIYNANIEDGLDKLHDKYETKHFRAFNKGTDAETIPYYSEIYESGAVERKPGTVLAWCRVRLGCYIYADLMIDGYCSIWAEC